jgi:hypothetical protein
MTTQALVEDHDEFLALYTDKSFDLGFDDEVDMPYAVIFQIQDLTDYEDVDRDNEVGVYIAPMRLTDKAKRTLLKSGSINADQLDDPVYLARAAHSYGYHAPVTGFATGVGIGATPSFKEVVRSDDYERIRDWILEHGGDLAASFRVGIGFALDRPVNAIGETGWDWLGPHMTNDYTSPTMYPLDPADAGPDNLNQSL